MAIPTNYAELQAEVADWLNRSDLTHNIPSFINFSEARINRTTKLNDQATTATITTTNNQDFANLPDRFLDHISLTYESTNYSNPVKVGIDILDKARGTTAAIPAYFAISDGKYYWDCKAKGALNLVARYYKKWDIATDNTNWLLSNYPDIYLYGALYEAFLFLKDERYVNAQVMFSAALVEAEKHSSSLNSSPLRVDTALLNGYLC